MTNPDIFPVHKNPDRPYPTDRDEEFRFKEQLTRDAKLWLHTADAHLNEDIDLVEQSGEDPTDLANHYEGNRKAADVINFLRQRVHSGDKFIIRLLADLQRTALEHPEDPEGVSTFQFDDLSYLLNEFKRST